eukprot:2974384-Pyramimonas_sp.AAC.1
MVFLAQAYAALAELASARDASIPLQRLSEVAAVAEQLHFKLCTLLLHSGSVPEAVSQCRTHLYIYKKLTPAAAPPAAHAVSETVGQPASQSASQPARLDCNARRSHPRVSRCLTQVWFYDPGADEAAVGRS